MKQTLHMMAEADGICNLARQAYNFEENEAWGFKLLKDGFGGISDEQVMSIINGDAMLTGWSICDDVKCTQCKGLNGITYIKKEDKDFKLEVQNHKLYVNTKYFKIGQFLIKKDLINEYAKTRLLYTRNRAEDLFVNDMEMVRNSFWSTTQHQRPSENYMPREGDLNYLFSKTIVPFIDELNMIIDNLTPLDARMIYEVMEKLEVKYAVIKDKLESEFKPKGERAEGCVLITVYDESDLPISFNLEKALYLTYIKARMSSYRKQKITMSQDIDKEKVMKRFKQYEKTVGYAHKEMMESINLHHSESGHYSAIDYPIEHDVNGILQWYMYELTIHNDDKNIKSLPNEMMLTAEGDAYVDGKLIAETIDLR